MQVRAHERAVKQISGFPIRIIFVRDSIELVVSLMLRCCGLSCEDDRGLRNGTFRRKSGKHAALARFTLYNCRLFASPNHLLRALLQNLEHSSRLIRKFVRWFNFNEPHRPRIFKTF